MRIPTPEDVSELFRPSARHPRLALVLGLLMLIALTVVRAQLNAALGIAGLPHLLFVLAVLGASWLGGWIPGVVTTLTGAVVAVYFFLGEPGTFFVLSSSEQVLTAIFLMVGIIVAGVCEALLRAREHVEEQSRQLQVEMRARQQRELERHEMERRKDEFLAVLAHELRNPLTPIVNAAALLHVRQHSDPTVKRAAQLIDRHSKHMVHLIDDLLDVARIERGTFELRRECVDVARILEAAEEHARRGMDEKPQQFTVRRPPHPVRVEGDQLRLVQVVTNLLNNASTYTPVGGHIELEASVAGSWLQLVVRDDGQGLVTSEHERIFGIFERGAGNRGGGGLGIGLALVRQIVLMHGGEVEASSEGEGRGSEFRVRIPGVSIGVLPSPTEPTEGTGATQTTALRILVVDDQADLIDSAVAVLQLIGHETLVASNGEDALQRMARERPDVVLMDVGMPGMTGYEVARRAALEHWRGAMKLVAMTGWGRDEDRQRALDAGFDMHVVKPLDLERLRQLLGSLVPSSQAAERA